MKKHRGTCHIVELALDAQSFPDRSAFIALVARLPDLGALKCLELGIAPEGGGRVAFVVQGASSGLRAALRALVGEAAIVRCNARPS
jgi:RNA 3'-terminal phosphate cyclase